MTRLSLLALAFSFVLTASQGAEVLRSTGELPAHVVGQFREPAAFQETASGVRFVFDRRGQSVHRVDRSGMSRQIIKIGPERGQILGASSFDLGPGNRFVVADAPNGRERVQIFDLEGTRIGGFTLPGRAVPRITLGNIVLNGISSLQFTGQSIVMNQPELGGLITRFSLNGHPFHTFGILRRTGYEADRNIHLALNSGLPLVNPNGGYYFVFQAGVPVFRKYDGHGNMLFERHVEGPELDSVLANLPTTWHRRTDNARREIPVISPTVWTAAVDPNGNLWVALTVPYLYVYDPSGEKIRTVHLRGSGPIQPISLFFPNPNRLLVTPGCYEFTVG